MINKLVSGRIFIDILNDRAVRRVLGLQATELCIDFNIQNNTLIMKLQDSLKVKNFKSGKPMKTSMFASKKEYALGRITTYQLQLLISILNGVETLKTKASLKKEEVITKLFMHGKFVSITAELKEDKQEAEKIDQPKYNPTSKVR